MTLADELKGFEPETLEGVDRRASLQRRVDQKYFVSSSQLSDLLDDLRRDHDVLEIDGRRTFEYRSVYFDTPELKCFHDHVEGRRPRYKMRTRHYVTTRSCVFEVKVKDEDDETAKESIDYDGEDAERLTDEARELIERTLRDAGTDLPQDLRPTMETSFCRSTLALRDGQERLTIDQRLRMTGTEGEALAMGEEWALLETKTADGRGRSDRTLAEAGVEPVSFSKYRLGVGRLATQGDDDYAEPLMRFFRS